MVPEQIRFLMGIQTMPFGTRMNRMRSNMQEVTAPNLLGMPEPRPIPKQHPEANLPI